MQDGAQAILYVLTVMDRAQTRVTLQLVTIVPYFLKLVAKNQTCY